MKINVDKINQAIKHLKSLLAIAKGNKRHLEKSSNLDINIHIRNASRNKLETNHEQAERLAHELHCLFVEMGFADYESRRYGEKIIRGSEGEKKELRRHPNT